MSRKNFKVDTAQKGQTTQHTGEHIFATKNANIVKDTNVPTGKVKTAEDAKKRREEREKNYREFRVNALVRRAKRSGILEEEIKVLIDKLNEQLNQPKLYTILILYSASQDKIITEMLNNNKIKYLMKSSSHAYFEGDATLLATLREILPAGVKIHPYAKKMPSVLPKASPGDTKKPHTKAARKQAATTAKQTRKLAHINRGTGTAKHRKRANIAAMSKKNRKDFMKNVKSLRAAWKASKTKKATIVPKDKTNASTGQEKASTGLKQAA